MSETDGTRRASSVVVSLALAACFFVAAVEQPVARVIGTLTAATREEAVQCGRKGAACAVVPYELCPDNRGYSAILVTPFSRVASAVMDAERTGRPLGRMGPPAVNRWGTSIQVSPSRHSATPDSIDRLELRRDGRVIAPTRTTLGPLTITMPDGATRESTRGFFAFPAEAFEASADLEIVFFGSFGESTCRLNRDRLRSLR